MRDFMTIAKAIADENRVRILLMLGNSELCVCQIIEVLGLAPSTVSKHLSILRQARLVDTRKDGRWIYYHIADQDAPAEAHRAIRWIYDSLAKDKRAMEDVKRLREVLEMDKEKLCSLLAQS